METPWSLALPNQQTQYGTPSILDSVLNTTGSNAVPATTSPGSTDFLSWDGFLGNSKTGTNGWAMPALAFGNSLFNVWSGMEQLDLGKKQLRENKRQFELNFGNQASLTNTRLRDRQAARHAFDPSRYESPDTYMQKNAVKEG